MTKRSKTVMEAVRNFYDDLRAIDPDGHKFVEEIVFSDKAWRRLEHEYADMQVTNLTSIPRFESGALYGIFIRKAQKETEK